jgi:ferredoxin-type protein NapH
MKQVREVGMVNVSENTKIKENFKTEKHARMVKQFIMGGIFIILLGAGWFFPPIGYFIPACMVVGIGMAGFKGRKWCNWFCPRGSFADAYMKIISPEKKIPQALRSLPVRIGVISFLMLMLAVQITRLWPDFYAIGGIFMLILTITTIIGAILAIIYQQRSWCYICPIGTMSSWVGKNRSCLIMDRSACIDCKLCEKTCPMQLVPYELKKDAEMSHRGDCLKCGLCVAVCPKKALSFP